MTIAIGELEQRLRTQVLNIKAAGRPSAVVPLAANTTLTQAEHEGRTMLLNTTSTLIVTLPAATGSGAIYEFISTATAPAGGHQIRLPAATLYNGIASVYGGTAFSGAANGTTHNNIFFSGTTTGGIIGTYVRLTDARAGFYTVQVHAVGSGVGSSPFAAV